MVDVALATANLSLVTLVFQRGSGREAFTAFIVLEVLVNLVASHI